MVSRNHLKVTCVIDSRLSLLTPLREPRYSIDKKTTRTYNSRYRLKVGLMINITHACSVKF